VREGEVEQVVTLLDLEGDTRDAALANDGLKRSDSDFRMIGDGYGDRVVVFPSLHDDMTSASPNDLESMLLKDAAYVLAGKNTELTHAPLRSV
jgi:hypothetical protein